MEIGDQTALCGRKRRRLKEKEAVLLVVATVLGERVKEQRFCERVPYAASKKREGNDDETSRGEDHK